MRRRRAGENPRRGAESVEGEKGGARRPRRAEKSGEAARRDGSPHLPFSAVRKTGFHCVGKTAKMGP